MPTKSQAIAADVTALLRARNPLIWVVTKEEARVESYLFEAAARARYVPRCWDVGQGVTGMDGRAQSVGGQDIGETLGAISQRALTGNERGVWILRDLPAWLTGTIGLAACRQVRNLCRLLPTVERDRAQALVVISPSSEVPPELAGHATVIDWPLPDREEITALLDAAIASLPDEKQASAAPNGERSAAIDAAIGLSGEEASACYARSLVQHGRIDPATVANEKRRVIAREKVLEWFDPLPGGLGAVGGLDALKGWLTQRKLAYSPKARAYGLPAPKGALLVGIPGCGKSLCAKAIATAWNVPLLRLDLNALKSKFVGESEANLRRAFRTIEAIGRCVVWCDEIEKALAGATQGASDGGVSSDALGTLLSWMQERQGEAFVFATSNDVSQLPPELLRKGRFDELFFVDLPTREERVEILSAAMTANGRKLTSLDANRIYEVIDATEGFTGAEMAGIVPDALFAAFADDCREITVDDLVASASTVVPLSKSMAERIDKLRQWAAGRARLATTPATNDATSKVATRKVDLDL